MTKRDINLSVPFVLPSIDLEDAPVWRPLSYYISGGIDVSGKATLLNGTPEYDGKQDENPDVFDSSEVLGQPLYDPRISGFDIAEELGVNSYLEATSALQTPAQSGEPSSD